MHAPDGFAWDCKPELAARVHAWTWPSADKGWMRSVEWVGERSDTFSPKYCPDGDQQEVELEKQQHRVGDGFPALCC